MFRAEDLASENNVSTMKVTIDRQECTSCGTCRETCSDMFEENPDDSLNQIVEKLWLKRNIAEGVPFESFEDCTVRAAELCCAEIIHVEESWK